MNTRPNLSAVYSLAATLCVAGMISPAAAKPCFNIPGNGNPNPPAVPTLHVGDSNLSLVPSGPWCVYPGQTLHIPVKVAPNSDFQPVDADDITVRAKAGDGSTISGSYHDADKSVHVTFATSLQANQDYGYAITVRDVGVLDPVGRIVSEFLAQDYLEAILRGIAIQAGVEVKTLEFARPRETSD